MSTYAVGAAGRGGMGWGHDRQRLDPVDAARDVG